MVGGNVSLVNTLQIVESGLNELNLGQIARKNSDTVIDIPRGTSYRFESEVIDKDNDNSAILTYFQYERTLKLDDLLYNNILMRYLAVPFYDDLRTK
jgi:secreted Zn-dependent insulinase-like peptidase